MGIGGFKEPPEGPKIGPTRDISELPPEKREELGDIEKLRMLADEPQLDPGLAEEDERLRAQGADPAAETRVIRRAEEGAERLEALRSVLDEQAEPQDPIDMEAEPTDEDKRAFMRCILGDTAYEKDYILFGGMIKIALRDLTPRQTDIVFTQLAIAQRDGKIETEDDWELMLDRFRLVAGSTRLLWAGKQLLGPFDFETGLYDASESLLASLQNSTIYRALLRVVRVFQRHLSILAERATDSGFWVVDGPDLPSEPTSEGRSTTQDGRPSAGI